MRPCDVCWQPARLENVFGAVCTVSCAKHHPNRLARLANWKPIPVKPMDPECVCIFGEGCFGEGDIRCLKKTCICTCGCKYPCGGCDDCNLE